MKLTVLLFLSVFFLLQGILFSADSVSGIKVHCTIFETKLVDEVLKKLPEDHPSYTGEIVYIHSNEDNSDVVNGTFIETFDINRMDSTEHIIQGKILKNYEIKVYCVYGGLGFVTISDMRTSFVREKDLATGKDKLSESRYALASASTSIEPYKALQNEKGYNFINAYLSQGVKAYIYNPKLSNILISAGAVNKARMDVACRIKNQ